MVKVDPDQELKCSMCKAVFYDNRELLESAGVIDGEEFYNTKCPNCRTYDKMSEDLVGVPDPVLEKFDKGEISLTEALEQKTEEQEEKDKEKAKKHTEF